MNSVHPDILNKIKNINYETLDNMIFYGPNGSGKYTLFKMFLEHIIGKKITTRIDTINFKTKSINVIISPYHYEILLDKKKYDKVLIANLVSYLTETKSVDGLSKIIFFKNAQFLGSEVMNCIKNCCETKSEYIKFIFTTNSLCKIKHKSLFMLIRVPLPPKDNILKVIGNNIQNEEIVEREKRNLSRIFFLLKYNKTSFESSNLKDSIKELIKTGDIKNLCKLREHIYDLASKNYDKVKFIKELFMDIHPKTKEIIDKTMLISRKIVKSYKDTIHLECYCVYLLLYYKKVKEKSKV